MPDPSVFGNLDPSLYLQDPSQDPGELAKTPMLEATIAAARQAVGLPPLMGKHTAMQTLQRMGGGHVEAPQTVGGLMEQQAAGGGNGPMG
jgi:hypothetical protein